MVSLKLIYLCNIDPAYDICVDEIDCALGMSAINIHANLTRHPALSIPCGEVDGLPVGLTIVGKHYDEQTLFNVGYTYEGIRDEK